MGDADTLQRIKVDMGDCQRCPLHTGRTHIVFGEGNPFADIMFIGEGPGETEDETGRPFCGRSGELLDETLAKAGLSRSMVYIANIVKCRPPDNRNPSSSEKAICTQFLKKQIEVIAPKVIVALGKVAASYLLDRDVKITQEHGSVWELPLTPEIPVVIIYHPAFILRNRNSIHEKHFFEDIKNVRRMVENGTNSIRSSTTGSHRDGIG